MYLARQNLTPKHFRPMFFSSVSLPLCNPETWIVGSGCRHMSLWMKDLKELDRLNHRPFNHLTDSYWALWCTKLTLGSNQTGNPRPPCNSYCTGRTRLGIKDSRRLLTLPLLSCVTLDMVLNLSVLQFPHQYGETHTISFFTVAQDWMIDIHKAIGTCKCHYRSTVGTQVVTQCLVHSFHDTFWRLNNKPRTGGGACWWGCRILVG